jgi:hypothetical protein
MPPRGGPPQRPHYRPPATSNESKTPGGRRRLFDVVIFLVVIALVAVFANGLGGALSPAANAGPTLNLKPAGTGGATTPQGSAVPSMYRPVITEFMPSNKGSITDEKGNYTDWIEIYNPTGQAISLAGFALSDNPKKPTKYVLPSYILDPGKFVIVYADNQPSTDTELHAQFKLKNADQVLLMTDPSGNVVQQIAYPALQDGSSYAMDMGTQEWASTNQYTPGFTNDDDGYAAYQQTRYATAPVGIDEVMASNTLTLRDADGEYGDWLEIFNPSDKDVDLTGWGLSNKTDEPKRWMFPSMKIEPGQYIVVFCSGKNRAVAGKELHTDFRINAFSDTVVLSNLRGQIVSEVKINRLDNDQSYALTPGTDEWQAQSHPTPGYPNTEEGWNSFQSKLYADTGDAPVVISEVMSNNVDKLKDQFGEYPDWIELYNRSGGDVNLKGWGLTDKSNELGRWQFPDVTLKSGQYITVFASGKNVADADAISSKKLHTDFKLSGSGGIVALTAPDGAIADRCFVPALRAGLSYERPTNGTVFCYSTSPSPGAANDNGYPGMAPEPAFSIKAGFYDTDQQVKLSTSDPEVKIYYTLDGKTPTNNSMLYTGPITLNKSAAVRAVAYRDGYLPSNAVCSTYLINLKAFFGADVNLPVVSLVTDPDNLYDPDTGIYVHYNQEEWERPAHIELLEVDGTVGFSQDVGIKISGAQSKKDNDQKSFGVFARSKYGKGSIDYKIFDDLPYTSFQALQIRNGGQDAHFSRIRAPVQLDLVHNLSDLHVDTQSYRTSLLFLNGEFFGIYEIMEKINEHFAAQRSGLDSDEVTVLTGNGKGTPIGSKAVQQEYRDLIAWVKTHDLSKAENYEYVASKIDIDSYIDWCTLETYVMNSDTGNIKFWRPNAPDGKWRWIFYDLDYGFWWYPGRGGENGYYDDPFERILDPEGNGIGNNFENVLVRKLLDNKGFREKYIQRFYYHCTVTFETNITLAKIKEKHDVIAPYFAKDKERFPKDAGSVATWEKNQIPPLEKYAKMRPEYNLNCMYKYFLNHYGMSKSEIDKIVGK